MAYRFVINYLRRDELVYELTVRGFQTTEAQTVDDLRTQFRQIWKLEKGGVTMKTPDFPFKFEPESAIITEKLAELSADMERISGVESKALYERIQTRLVHLLSRCDRLPVTKTNAEARGALMTSVLNALSRLDSLPDNDPELSMRLNEVPLENGPVEPANPPEPIPPNADPLPTGCVNLTSTPAPPLSSSVTLPPRLEDEPAARMPQIPRKADPIYKWNVKFSGEPTGLSVFDFLERLEELRLARKVTKLELFESAYDLFEGKARNWYANNRTRFGDWSQLTELLIAHYSPPDYRQRLFSNILERTQDSDESIVDYLTCMGAMFRRYGLADEQTRLDIISRNLAPFYSSQLPVVTNLTELETECLKLETKKYRVDSYVPSSKKRINFVDASFASTSSSTGITRPRHHAHAIETNAAPLMEQAAIQVPPSRKPVTCFNCRHQGHLSVNCPEPRNFYCFGCKRPGVTRRNCPQCSRPGNETSRDQ